MKKGGAGPAFFGIDQAEPGDCLGVARVGFKGVKIFNLGFVIGASGIIFGGFGQEAFCIGLAGTTRAETQREGKERAPE